MAREVRTIVAGKRVIAGVTPEHPFYDARRGTYRPVRELVPGDIVVALSSEGVHASVIERICAKEIVIPAIRVFNLTIDGLEANYFAEGILVHNKSPPPDHRARRTPSSSPHTGAKATSGGRAISPWTGRRTRTFPIERWETSGSTACYPMANVSNLRPSSKG
jgi:hypothetical protein